ncbi:MAG: PEP-CTERM sorting domain-containing protein [Calothrix sp. SM1_7_51]|nr:PEP-CTERM sorting domain-containing protein [Calothrix sp. SM1_7_51]
MNHLKLALAIFSTVCITIATGEVVKAATITEYFDDISTLAGKDWVQQNNSQPVGSTAWFQGEPGTFNAQSGAPNSYIAANYDNTSGFGTISNWLLTPVFNLQNGDTISFFTSSIEQNNFPDRLELRLSTNGLSTDVGASATSVGDFTTVLLDINPSLATNTYPETGLNTTSLSAVFLHQLQDGWLFVTLSLMEGC